MSSLTSWLPRPVDALFGMILLLLLFLLGGSIVLCLVSPFILVWLALERGGSWPWAMAGLSVLFFLCATMVLSSLVAWMRDWWRVETPVYRTVRLMEETARLGPLRRYARTYLSKFPDL